MTGGNQLKLAAVVTGTAFGRRGHRRPRPRCRRRRYVGRREHPGRAHDRLRPVRRHPAAADEPAGRRARPGPGRDRRPALRPAEPVRPAAVAGRPVPRLLGIGVDEDTAAVVRGTHLEVVGRGAVTIFDGSQISNAHTAKRSEPILASGVDCTCCPRRRRSTCWRALVQYVEPPAGRRDRRDPGRRGGPAEAGQGDRRRGGVTQVLRRPQCGGRSGVGRTSGLPVPRRGPASGRGVRDRRRPSRSRPAPTLDAHDRDPRNQTVGGSA